VEGLANRLRFIYQILDRAEVRSLPSLGKRGRQKGRGGLATGISSVGNDELNLTQRGRAVVEKQPPLRRSAVWELTPERLPGDSQNLEKNSRDKCYERRPRLPFAGRGGTGTGFVGCFRAKGSFHCGARRSDPSSKEKYQQGGKNKKKSKAELGAQVVRKG